jgi:hypothetical protein
MSPCEAFALKAEIAWKGNRVPRGRIKPTHHDLVGTVGMPLVAHMVEHATTWLPSLENTKVASGSSEEAIEPGGFGRQELVAGV